LSRGGEWRWLDQRFTQERGKSFLDRMIALLEGAEPLEDAERDRPQRPAGDHLRRPSPRCRHVQPALARRAASEACPAARWVASRPRSTDAASDAWVPGHRFFASGPCAGAECAAGARCHLRVAPLLPAVPSGPGRSGGHGRGPQRPATQPADGSARVARASVVSPPDLHPAGEATRRCRPVRDRRQGEPADDRLRRSMPRTGISTGDPA
jgi:hypothetical protein